MTCLYRDLRIGPLQLQGNLLLAPMAGYCDLSFRLAVRELGGVSLACTDLLSPQGLLRGTRTSLELAATCPADSPLCMQIYGCEPELMAEAARWAEDHGAAAVDINMGCPVDKITKRDGGSKLLCDPPRALRIAERMRAALRAIPLTAKLRLGWDDDSIVAPQLARQLREVGVAAITIHGRTTQMKFGGTVRLDGIAAVVAMVSDIPVIGNGDIRRPEDAADMLRRTGCAGVMIGRGALSAPWVFRDTEVLLRTGHAPPPPGLREKTDIMRRHFQNLCQFRGEMAAMKEFRQRISWYAKQLQPCKPLRERMRKIQSAADFVAAIDEFLEERTAASNAV